MSDEIKHECGIALIRLLKPLSFYVEKYGTPFYSLNKLYLLMEKQHNRGQDGAGVAGVKFHVAPGEPYIFRYRSARHNPIKDIFEKIYSEINTHETNQNGSLSDVSYVEKNVGPASEILLGHLRYGTHSTNSIEQCHPFLRQSNWRSRNLVMAGNFNLTNNDELFQKLISLGQHPRNTSDTVTVMEKVGHFLDEENEELYNQYKNQGHTKEEISSLIASNLSLENVLKRATRDFDGGFALAGLIGQGDAFVIRDAAGIRPAFYYHDDEICVITSERPPIQTAFNVKHHQINEVPPGHAVIISRKGEVKVTRILDETEKKSCSFERIYFSRGTDRDIYLERKNLGKNICEDILKAVNFDFENTVFSYIPNTAEVAFLGMAEAVEGHLNDYKKRELKEIGKYNEEQLDALLSLKPRIEKIAVKDAKLRTFITSDEGRSDLVAHVYDTTYGIIRRGIDTLVVIDDSIVRGTTLKESIIRILDRLGPKKIIVVSSAPQIRYPDCYGIDMSKLKDFVAFRAVVALLRERNQDDFLEEIYWRCKAQEELPRQQVQNLVKEIYNKFSNEEITNKISELLTPEDIQAEIQVIYQGIESLHNAIPNHTGDWYFTGNYPTPGGNRVVNKAFINYFEGKNVRAY